MNLLAIVVFLAHVADLRANRFADQLYEDLLYYYNKNVRPVKNSTDSVKVKFGASLIRIIDVDEVNQVLTTNLWLEMQWYDYKLSWDPAKWNGIKKLHIPSESIWIPDILLYNNADGDPHITTMSDALVYYTGLVVWKPPSIYKSFCSIDIEFFPYDRQSCTMKFGGWSYNGFLMEVRQLPSTESPIENRLDGDGKEFQHQEIGMDLSGFYPSAEWDLMSLTSDRHEQIYPGCCGQEFYIDVTFELAIRRKTLFYTVNLVIPTLLIAILTNSVFYVPPIEHKMTLSIQIFVALTVFYLVLIELIPPTSLVIPLIGKYLLFTILLVSFSIILSVVSVNFYRRDGSSQVPYWLKTVFIKTLPRFLCFKPFDQEDDDATSNSDFANASNAELSSRRPSPFFLAVPSEIGNEKKRLSDLAKLRGMHPDLIRRMIDNISFIADHFRAINKSDKVSAEWSYVAHVMDRIILMVFTMVNTVGSIYIIIQAPALYDTRDPMQILAATRPMSGDTFENANFNFSQQAWWEGKI